MAQSPGELFDENLLTSLRKAYLLAVTIGGPDFPPISSKLYDAVAYVNWDPVPDVGLRLSRNLSPKSAMDYLCQALARGVFRPAQAKRADQYFLYKRGKEDFTQHKLGELQPEELRRTRNLVSILTNPTAWIPQSLLNPKAPRAHRDLEEWLCDYLSMPEEVAHYVTGAIFNQLFPETPLPPPPRG